MDHEAYISEVRMLTMAINRLAAVLERSPGAEMELAKSIAPRYQPHTVEKVIDEATMAGELGIPQRTLARYRREGRFPSCWIKNARRVRWDHQKTLAAWQRGIA